MEDGFNLLILPEGKYTPEGIKLAPFHKGVEIFWKIQILSWFPISFRQKLSKFLIHISHFPNGGYLTESLIMPLYRSVSPSL